MRRLRSARHPGESRGLRLRRLFRAGVPAFAGMTMLCLASPLVASEGEKPVARDYSLVRAAAAPRTQEWDAAEAKSAGCVSCHTDSDQQDDALEPGGGARLHRLPRRQCGGRRRSRASPRRARPMSPRATRRTSCPNIRNPGTGRRAPIRSAATPCSTSRARNMSASSIRPTIGSPATAAAPAISRRSRRPSAR